MTKESVVFFILLFVLGWPVPAWADDTVLFESELSDSGLYVSGLAGLSLHSDSDLEQSGSTVGKLSFDTGYAYGGAVGYQFKEPFRVEGEFSYRGYNADRIDTSGTFLTATGDVSVLSLMVNGYHDLTYGEWKPYLGVGFGVADVSWNNVASSATSPIDNNDYVIALQFMAGVGYAFTPSLTATAGYRLFGTSDPKFTAQNGAIVSGEVISNEFALGFRYLF